MAGEAAETYTGEERDQKQKLTKLIGLIGAITTLIIAVTALVTALTGVGKWIAQLFGHEPLVPGPAPAPTPVSVAVNAMQQHIANNDWRTCRETTIDAFTTNKISPRYIGPYWVQGEVDGTQVLILCGWDPVTNTMIITAGANSDKVQSVANDYRVNIFDKLRDAGQTK